jgi:hypothetical protein
MDPNSFIQGKIIGEMGTSRSPGLPKPLLWVLLALLIAMAAFFGAMFLTDGQLFGLVP